MPDLESKPLDTNALIERANKQTFIAQQNANKAHARAQDLEKELKRYKKAFELTTRGNPKQMDWWLERADEQLAAKPLKSV